MAAPYLAASWPVPPQTATKVDFNREVAPIFKAHCVSCHSGKEPAGELDLSSASSIAKANSKGKLLIAGRPDRSNLLRRVLGLDGLPRMPMGFAPLSEESTATLRRWIAGGAALNAGSDARHWAYVAPKQAPLPPATTWSSHPIDRFIAARLKKLGLKPSPRASKERLLRRVSLDLTGLPPTVEEVQAFLADKRPDAYARVVDRLLASPHYGEKQARLWLDLARYADSDGYEKDLRRTAWKYRDWVIDAYNQNMPFDRFTLEQIAGDLLPNAQIDDLIATGFHRNTMLNLEGGVDQEEAHFNVVLDRVATTGTVWMGATIACARCHDHKYDPYSQRDFYSMAAFFDNSKIYPRGDKSVGEEKWFERSIEAPTPEQTKRLTALQASRAEVAKRLASPKVDDSFASWREEVRRPIAWTGSSSAAKSRSGAALERQSDGSWIATGVVPAQDVYTVALNPNPSTLRAIRIEALPDDRLPNKGPGRAENGNFVVNRLSVMVNGKNVALGEAKSDFSQSSFRVDGGITGADSGAWAISPQMGRAHQLIVDFVNPVAVGANDRVEVVIGSESPYATHVLGKFRVTVTDSPVARFDLAPANVKSGKSEKALRDYFVATSPALKPDREALAKIDREIAELRREIPTALVMEDKPTTGPLQTVMHPRGEFLQRGEKVTANVPTFLPPLPPDVPRNRVGLAKWLVDRRNPLTARVQVNRMWESIFGRGFVETSEDFGTQGSTPTHPELLDWLAIEFAKKWDVKGMLRLIVTSETYKQTSDANPTLLAKDPQNLWLARGPRFRLEAEAIRDTALAAAGLLNPKIGGPSVMPHQPAGVWDTPYNGEQWMQSAGGDAYRRGLYTFWKRTSPYPNFVAFDATSREFCTVRRIRTNTPLQALALLNDEAMLAAARGLASRMLTQATVAERVRFGFIACTGRSPTTSERARIERLAQTLHAKYERDATAARKLGATAEQAAWTMVANVLLNLDETITKS